MDVYKCAWPYYVKSPLATAYAVMCYRLNYGVRITWCQVSSTNLLTSTQICLVVESSAFWPVQLIQKSAVALSTMTCTELPIVCVRALTGRTLVKLTVGSGIPATGTHVRETVSPFTTGSPRLEPVSMICGGSAVSKEQTILQFSQITDDHLRSETAVVNDDNQWNPRTEYVSTVGCAIRSEQ